MYMYVLLFAVLFAFQTISLQRSKDTVKNNLCVCFLVFMTSSETMPTARSKWQDAQNTEIKMIKHDQGSI